MTILHEANAAALGHLVAIRDIIATHGPTVVQHAALFDEMHRDKEMVADYVLVMRAYLTRFNEAISRLDPNAAPAHLEPVSTEPVTPPDDAAPSGGSFYPGMMISQNELEALRTHRIGQVTAHARSAITARFTAVEALRWQELRSQSLAADADAAPPLTEAEMAELNALDLDQVWAESMRNALDERVDLLLVADQAALESHDVDGGWPE